MAGSTELWLDPATCRNIDVDLQLETFRLGKRSHRADNAAMASMTTGAAPSRTLLHRNYLRLAIYATTFTLLFGACGGTDTLPDPTDGPGECGSGKVEGDEVCDGADLAGKSCQSLGLPEGKLSCRADCGGYDTSGCGAPATCGNGALDAGELCDGAELGGKNCQSLGSPGGTLACKNSCLDYDTSGCESLATCGNGALDDAEACDGDMLGGKSCQSEGFAGGSLSCAPTCLELDTTGCTGVCTPECSGRVCGADPVCGKSCGTCSGAHEACGADGQCQVTCDLDPIDADRVLDINLETATVGGTVTLDGAALPGGGRPYLRFQNKSLGDVYLVDLPTSGAAAYTAKLWKGAYDVSVRDRQNSVIGIGSGLGTKVLRGCYDVPGGGTCADWNGTWRFDVEDSSGIDDVDLIMKAVGNVLSGTWHSTSGYSGTFTGTRTGGDYQIEFDFSGCQWRIEGSTAGCSLSATIDFSCNSTRTATGVIVP